MLKYFGLGEPFGKASSANTALGLGRFVPMRERSPWILEGWLRHPSEAWPYEVLEKGLPKPLPKRMKNWGVGKKAQLDPSTAAKPSTSEQGQRRVQSLP